MTTENKIQGVLAMAAIGDSMGAATENLTFDQIRAMYHGPVSTFLKPGKQNFALGNEAGECTDDFSQIWFLSNAIVDNQGTIDKETVIRAMLAWSDVPKYFDRFAGPTTRTAIAMYRDPNRRMQPLPGAVTVDYASKATNGAAMKIAPAAMLHSDDIEGAVADAVTITQVTHDNSLAISGACATAAASSAGLARILRHECRASFPAQASFAVSNSLWKSQTAVAPKTKNCAHCPRLWAAGCISAKQCRAHSALSR